MRLAQQISELSKTAQTSGMTEPEVGELQERLTQLEDEMATLRLQCAEKDGELEEAKRRHDEQLEGLEVEKEARRELVQRVEEAEERTYRLRTEAELEKF